ncbi:DUF2523 domain-containing protein [Vibrio vulnificus]|uniref:DUF2523 family protein n=1 Tax=Vibrio vulnificus TaxID=672 RepID=UPI000CD30506|nr:DUF2523 family protein [Vibrio vulnificus]POC46636.1 DUF2523 domain-containing protein [Vibrio vulnificus]
MQLILDFLAFLSSIGDTFVEFITSIPDYFHQFFVYLNAWYVKIKFYFFIISLQMAYDTAVYLLNDIGFNQMISSSFNALPSELRYYAFLFKIPQAISIYFNCLATAFVLRMTRF